MGWGGPTKILGDGEMMEDEDGSNTRSLWNKLGSYVSSVGSSWVLPSKSETPQEEVVGYLTTSDCASAWNGYDGGWTFVDASTYYQYPQNSNSYSCSGLTLSYPISGTWPDIEPEKKKCNFCGTETADYRELKIGRMTNVVVCDMCMLKALSRSLSEVDDGGDGKCDGDGKCGTTEEGCGHGCKEGEEKG